MQKGVPRGSNAWAGVVFSGCEFHSPVEYTSGVLAFFASSPNTSLRYTIFLDFTFGTLMRLHVKEVVTLLPASGNSKRHRKRQFVSDESLEVTGCQRIPGRAHGSRRLLCGFARPE
ncbi:hypothetical protein J6590_005636 [Homalodisca vitripennis]|nr:hypothetical protein J6590_005636 [Homalodisca vitripennis]